MKRARVRYRLAAFREIRTSPEARRVVRGIADDIAAAAGGDVVAVETEAPRSRARAAVLASSESDRNRILSNIEAGRR